MQLMKKLFSTILVLCFLLSGNAYAEIKMIKDETIYADNVFDVTTLCIDSQKFVVMQFYRNLDKGLTSSITTTQIFEERNGKSLPVGC